MNRLFARTLNSSRQLIEEAASGTLVLNERAHELLGESQLLSELDCHQFSLKFLPR